MQRPQKTETERINPPNFLSSCRSKRGNPVAIPFERVVLYFSFFLTRCFRRHVIYQMNSLSTLRAFRYKKKAIKYMYPHTQDSYCGVLGQQSFAEKHCLHVRCIHFKRQRISVKCLNPFTSYHNPGNPNIPVIDTSSFSQWL